MLVNLLYIVVVDWKQLIWEKDCVNFQGIEKQFLGIKNIFFYFAIVYILPIYA